MKNSEQITMAHVAERAGVSRSAVSAAFSDRASTAVLRSETRRRILAAAEQLGYRPNILSRSFIKQRSFLIGMLGREAYFLFALETIKGIEDVLEETDYSLLTMYRGDGELDQAQHLRKCVSRRVDGIIVVGVPERPDGPNHQTIRTLQKRGMPIVQVYQRLYPDVPGVVIDDEYSGYLATQHLLELGHRRIAHVTHNQYQDLDLPGKHGNALGRYRGYCRAMKEAGLQSHVLPFARQSSAMGSHDYSAWCADAARELATGPQRFTAATTFNDFVVIGLINSLSGMGLKVPQDISLVGYDNIEACSLVRPAVTSVKPALMEIGRRAAAMVLKMLDGRTVEDVVLRPELIVRGSTAAPKDASRQNA
jgi:LacI family transcriptional regulator